MFKKICIIFLMSSLFLSCGSKDTKIKSVSIMNLAADPGAYTGKIEIKGIVQEVDSKKCVFRLIDEEEYKSCGLNPCGSAGIITIYTPDSTKPLGKTPSDLSYKAKMPKIEEKVTVEGEIKKIDNKFSFEVDKVIKGSEEIIVKNQQGE